MKAIISAARRWGFVIALDMYSMMGGAKSAGSQATKSRKCGRCNDTIRSTGTLSSFAKPGELAPPDPRPNPYSLPI